MQKKNARAFSRSAIRNEIDNSFLIETNKSETKVSQRNYSAETIE